MDAHLGVGNVCVIKVPAHTHGRHEGDAHVGPSVVLMYVAYG